MKRMPILMWERNVSGESLMFGNFIHHGALKTLSDDSKCY